MIVYTGQDHSSYMYQALYSRYDIEQYASLAITDLLIR